MARTITTHCLLSSLAIPLVVGSAGTFAWGATPEAAAPAGASAPAAPAMSAGALETIPVRPSIDPAHAATGPQRPLWSCPVPLAAPGRAHRVSLQPDKESSAEASAEVPPGVGAPERTPAATDGAREPGGVAASTPPETEPSSPPADCPPFVGRWARRLPPPSASSDAGMGAAWDEEEDEQSPICAEGDTRCSPTPARKAPTVIPLWMVEGALNAPPWPRRIRYPRPAPPRVLGTARDGYPHPPFEPPRAPAAA